jgi:hypothetical protein
MIFPELPGLMRRFRFPASGVCPALLFPGADCTPPLFIFALSPFFSLSPSVAHGYVSKVVIDGTTYNGNILNAKPSDSLTRQISDIGPVKGSNNPSLNFGLNASWPLWSYLPTLARSCSSTGEILVGNSVFLCFPRPAPFARRVFFRFYSGHITLVRL